MPTRAPAPSRRPDGGTRGRGPAVGGRSARGGGRSGGARDLDPAHHRDGLGLTFLAAALVVAVGVWFSAGGPLGAAVSALVYGAVGITAALVPLPLAAAPGRR